MITLQGELEKLRRQLEQVQESIIRKRVEFDDVMVEGLGSSRPTKLQVLGKEMF